MLISGADGSLDKFNVIVVDWPVHPDLYRDNLARLTIFWTTNGYQHTSCFNLSCPGDIPKSSKYGPGIALNEGPFPLSISKDKEAGDWCISSTFEGKTEELIGCVENSYVLKFSWQRRICYSAVGLSRPLWTRKGR